MNLDLVIQLAQETIFTFPNENPWDFTLKTADQHLHFAQLVAAHEQERYEAHQLQQEAWNIDTQYASVLALMLECMILDPRRWHDDAVKVLDQYRAEWDKLNPSPSPFGKD